MIKMATTNQQRAQCVLWCAKFESVKRVQREFRLEYGMRNVPKYNSIMFRRSQGSVKDIVYSQKSRNIDDLRVKIAQAFQQITPLMLPRTWAELHHCYELCRKNCRHENSPVTCKAPVTKTQDSGRRRIAELIPSVVQATRNL
ncbi:hypothetical protein ANN_15980 [Periplaneta americana]|uniref:DUF4817 domain-containing protein n=1 Tax=Periplaneta americana TaxID=6978 RepID=A0ABQ8SIR1_PERAM|nr:hypothetical protein ANN_15980 [Periplaneta americana]